MNRAGSNALNLVFAGGGTGGHIYPALAIAEEAVRLDRRVTAHILCSRRKVDREILARERVAHTSLPAQPPVMNPAGLMRFALSWVPSVALTRLVLEEHLRTGPTLLVAMGGFVCPPAVKGAIRERVPVALVNLDAVPGKANRWVAERAEMVFTAAGVEENWPLVGPIVRPGLIDPFSPSFARQRFRLDERTKTLLVTGGSQGAKSINDLVVGLLGAHPGAFAGWQAIHQTGGQHDPGPVRAAYAKAGVRAWVGAYLGPDEISAAWAAADLSIGRCGAGTVGEAWATRTPAVFLPYPYHKDQHQKRNAEPLVRAGAAIVLDDLIEGEQNLASHAGVLTALLGDSTRFAALAEPARRLGPADGAARVAKALLGRLEAEGDGVKEREMPDGAAEVFSDA